MIGAHKLLLLVAIVLVGGLVLGEISAMADDPRLASFEMSDLEQTRREQNRAYLEFLRTNSMHCGIYHLAAGSEDSQSPHEEDELYYVQHGVGKFLADGKDVDVVPGSILFVKANEKHHFHSIEEDLTLLVFFSTAKPTKE